MKRSFLLAAVLAVALVVPASALAYTPPTWNLNGTYTIDFTLTSPDTGDYIHSMTITTTSDTIGAVTGTGYYLADSSHTWTVTGSVTAWAVTLHVLYTGTNAGYTVDMAGAIDQWGGMAGTATGPGQTFTWKTTAGSVSLFSPRCTSGTYPHAQVTWSGFAPGTGGIVTTPALDPTRDYFVEASGTYFAGGNGPFDIQADAEYSQDAAQRAATPAVWTVDVNGYESYGEQLLDLLVNGQNVDWGTFNTDHRYTLDVTPTGSPLTIGSNIYDTFPSNNTGGLCVAVFVRDYHFTGFFAPIDNLPVVNLAKAGSAIPVKFSLGGDWGLNIFAVGYPKSTNIECGASALSDDTEITVTAGGSSLSYDPLTNQYNYVWKTDKKWAAGTCRQLVVMLADGTSHIANFKFK
jgi:hypothetical protein